MSYVKIVFWFFGISSIALAKLLLVAILGNCNCFMLFHQWPFQSQLVVRKPPMCDHLFRSFKTALDHSFSNKLRSFSPARSIVFNNKYFVLITSSSTFSPNKNHWSKAFAPRNLSSSTTCSVASATCSISSNVHSFSFTLCFIFFPLYFSYYSMTLHGRCNRQIWRGQTTLKSHHWCAHLCTLVQIEIELGEMLVQSQGQQVPWLLPH